MPGRPATPYTLCVADFRTDPDDNVPDGDSLDPIYLRPPDAQRWRERDTSQRTE